ncbi:MAG: nucleotidyltransferase family protein [Clostridiales bacterium]|nr:nucleotidyltransferase family protein [Clostridiales bacterium]
MNIGIICEFNPFHKGHKYLIDSVKGAGDSVICCMSSNFVQRGDFAIYDKFTRAKTALQNGADLIIELPTPFCTLSAEGFAKSAVGLLENLKVIDKIAFGAECADIGILTDASKKLQSPGVQQQIALEMKSGISYPAARKKVLGSQLFDCPNNILALEYLKFATLPCVAVKRIGLGHDSGDPEYSASAIRATLSGENVSLMQNCERAVLARLRGMAPADFAAVADVSEGLENRIYRAARQATSLEELYGLIKTKRYTMSRVKRIVLRSFLGIEGAECDVPYIHVLGFTQSGKALLGKIKEKSPLPIITGVGDCDDKQKRLFERECYFTDLHALGYPTPLPCGREQRARLQ